MLKVGYKLGAKKVQVFTDSKLFANQFGGSYEARYNKICAYLDIVRSLVYKFTSITIICAPRNDVQHRNFLAYLVATIKFDTPRMIVVEFQQELSIEMPIE